MKWWQRTSLRLKLALGIGLVMLVTLGGAFVAISQYVQAQLWQREAQAAMNLNAVAATLLKDAMMVGHRDQIQQALETLGQNVGGRIDAIAVYDDDSRLTSFASGFPGGRTIARESLAQEITDPGCWQCHQLPAGQRPAMTVVSLEGQEVMRSVVPLYNEPRCQTCHGTGLQVLGDSIVDLSLVQFEQASTATTAGLGAGIALTVALVALVFYFLLRGTVLTPLGELTSAAQAVTRGDLDRRVKVRGSDEVGQVGLALNEMTARLRELIGSLEQRVAERTRDLEKHSAYLEASSDVAQAASSILDADALVRQTIHLIQERFGLYYVGLFLVDEQEGWASLAAGTGEAGQATPEQRDRIRVGEGLIGRSIADVRARVAVKDDAADPLLASQGTGPDALVAGRPGTRAEAAIPLRSRGRVLGALSVHSTEADTFDPNTLSVLQTMADQVAVALDNARLFAESQAAMEAERRAYGLVSRDAWGEAARRRHAPGYVCDQQDRITESPGEWRPEMAQAARTGQLVQDGGATLAVPVRIRENVEAVVRLRKPDGAHDWTPAEVELTRNLADQLGVALESARLYQDSQRRATREQLVGEVTARMRETLDMDTVLRTAIREIGQALDLAEVEVRIGEYSSTEVAQAYGDE